MARSHSENVALNTGASITMKLVAQLLGFVMQTVFIYMLGDQYNGVDGLFSDILSMLQFAELGIGSAITFALYKPLKENNPVRVAALMNFYRRAYQVVALVIVGAGLALVPFLSVFVKNVPEIRENITVIYLLCIANTASSYLFIYRSTLLSANQRYYLISKISIIFSVIRTAVQCLALMLFKNYYLYLVIGIVESLIRNMCVSRMIGNQFPDVFADKQAKLPKEDVHRLFQDFGALMLYKVSGVALSSADSMIISSSLFSGVVMVGFLRNYRTIISTISMFTGQFFSSLTPSLGHLAVDASPDRQYSVYKTLHFVSFWMACFTATCLAVLINPFISIWLRGSSRLLPPLVVFALLLDNYISVMMRPFNTFRSSNGLFVQGKMRPLAMAILNVGLSLALAKPLGVFGVLIATTISRLCTQFWYDPYLIYSRVFQRPLKQYFIQFTKYTLVTALCFGATYGLCYLLPQWHALTRFGAQMVICLIVPNAIVIAIFHRTEEYQQFMERLVPMLHKLRDALMRRAGRA